MQIGHLAGKESLKQAVRQNNTIVILGETGSGKTTRKPPLEQPSVVPRWRILKSPFRGSSIPV